MFRFPKFRFTIAIALLGAFIATAGPADAGIVDPCIVDVEFGVNTETISQIALDITDQNNQNFVQTQTMPRTAPTDFTLAQSANLQYIRLSDSTILNEFNIASASIVSPSFPTDGTVEVFSNGAVFEPGTPGSPGSAAFITELGQVHSNGDLASYIRVDGTSTDSLWEVQYTAPVDPSSYLIVQERNGNTDFSITALDIDGNEIGDTLRFDAPSYQWDTGIKNFLDPINNEQTQELSVIDFSLFNTTQDVYGFSVVNTGNADFKFFFANAAPVPEPGSTAVVLTLLAGVGLRRRRQATAI